MKLKKMIICVISLLLIAILINVIKQDIWDKNEKLLKEKVLSIEETVEIVDLSYITPFEWTSAYSFSPYTPIDKIYDTVGYKWDDIKETVNEGMNQIVFLNEDKVVCYLYGYSSTNGYVVNFNGKDYENGANILKVDDNSKFQVTRNDGIVYLQQK